MRLRSTDSGDSQATTARNDGKTIVTMRQGEPELPLLPEQAATVRQLQQETGRGFEECAIELGYVPESAITRFPRSVAPSVLPDEQFDVDPLIVMMSNPDDPVATAARELRSVLGTMRRRDGNPLRRVALLSLQARTESSVLVANLAVACALSGQRTLLIDANFSAPVQHGLFRRAGSKGISQMLAQKAEAHSLIQTTMIPRLDLLPNGHADEDTVELTDRSALALATEHVSEGYDAVIVDAGEADQVGISCVQGFDGTVVVVQRGVTALKDARKLVERLRSGGELPVGMVVID